jgi:hypothetical protein
MLEYNPLFEKLVLGTEEDSPDRLIAILAYGEYKLDKYEYFKAFNERHGTNPSAEQEKDYLLAFNDRRLDEMRSSAETRLYSFADDFLQQQIEDIKLSAVENSIAQHVEKSGRDLLDRVKKLTNFKLGIVVSALGAFLYTLLVAISVFTLTVTNSDSTVAKLTRAILTDSQIVVMDKTNSK